MKYSHRGTGVLCGRAGPAAAVGPRRYLTLSILGENGLSLNLYTILFIVFFGIGYGASMPPPICPSPMVADCSDYETYRSGQYIPGVVGTLFSLVDDWSPACLYRGRRCGQPDRPVRSAHPV